MGSLSDFHRINALMHRMHAIEQRLVELEERAACLEALTAKRGPGRPPKAREDDGEPA